MLCVTLAQTGICILQRSDNMAGLVGLQELSRLAAITLASNIKRLYHTSAASDKDRRVWQALPKKGFRRNPEYTTAVGVRLCTVM